jgi:hypothetical protein
MATAIEDVGVDHGGFDVFVSEQFLDGADVVTVLEQVGGEGVAEGVATDALGDFGVAGSLFDSFLQATFVEVVTDNFATARIFAAGAGGKSVLPNPLPIGVGMFAIVSEG